MYSLIQREKKQDGASTIRLGEFKREEFFKTLGTELYAGLDENDYDAMYERAFGLFVHNQGKPVTIEPVPLSPEQIEGPILYDQLIDLEATIGLMYSFGFGALCAVLGRDPKEE